MSVPNRTVRGLALLAASSVFASMVSAGLFDPPGWGNHPNTTNQKWTFPTQWGSDNGNAADPNYWNPNGAPYGSADGATDTGRWIQTLQQPNTDGHTGLMVLNSGPLGNPPDPDQFVTFTVKNTEHTERQKEYWVKVIYKGSIRARVAATLGGTFQEVSMNTSNTQGTDWKERVYTGTLGECPPFENFKIINNKAMGPTYIDSVEIHTRCIPTPAGVALLLFGAAVSIRRRG